MTEVNDDYDQNVILDFANDAVVANSKPPESGKVARHRNRKTAVDFPP